SAFSTRKAHVQLNGSIPWTIELDGGITDLTGSLEAVTLERMDVDGGANHVNLALPRAPGTAAPRGGSPRPHRPPGGRDAGAQGRGWRGQPRDPRPPAADRDRDGPDR